MINNLEKFKTWLDVKLHFQALKQPILDHLERHLNDIKDRKQLTVSVCFVLPFFATKSQNDEFYQFHIVDQDFLA